jgi:hypothetical protein
MTNVGVYFFAFLFTSFQLKLKPQQYPEKPLDASSNNNAANFEETSSKIFLSILPFLKRFEYALKKRPNAFGLIPLSIWKKGRRLIGE